MDKDKNGYIVVETIGTFIPFVLLIVSILSLVNIVTLQSRVHYAITQAANTISMYSYVLEATGLGDELIGIDEEAAKVDKEIEEIKENINKVIKGFDSLSYGEIHEGGNNIINQVSNLGEDIISNPSELLDLVINYGLNESKNLIFQDLFRPLVGRYLKNGDLSGDQYLESVNVIDGLDGLDFDGSTLIDEDENIKLAVYYEVEYKFGALPLPFEPKLRIMQTVKTKAWLGGRGKGYW